MEQLSNSMDKQNLQIGERAIVVAINGEISFRKYLLTNGISLGTVVTKNYSPNYSRLINFSVGSKMLSLRSKDFDQLDLVRI